MRCHTGGAPVAILPRSCAGLHVNCHGVVPSLLAGLPRCQPASQQGAPRFAAAIRCQAQLVFTLGRDAAGTAFLQRAQFGVETLAALLADASATSNVPMQAALLALLEGARAHAQGGGMAWGVDACTAGAVFVMQSWPVH